MKKKRNKIHSIIISTIIIIALLPSITAINKTDEKVTYTYENLSEQKIITPPDSDGPWVHYGSLHGIFFIRGFYDIPAIRNKHIIGRLFLKDFHNPNPQ